MAVHRTKRRKGANHTSVHRSNEGYRCTARLCSLVSWLLRWFRYSPELSSLLCHRRYKKERFRVLGITHQAYRYTKACAVYCLRLQHSVLSDFSARSAIAATAKSSGKSHTLEGKLCTSSWDFWLVCPFERDTKFQGKCLPFDKAAILKKIQQWLLCHATLCRTKVITFDCARLWRLHRHSPPRSALISSCRPIEQLSSQYRTLSKKH